LEKILKELLKTLRSIDDRLRKIERRLKQPVVDDETKN